MSYQDGYNLDQSNFLSNNSISFYAWQSFTPAANGYLNFATFSAFVTSGTHTITCYVYSGEGLGGTLVATATAVPISNTVAQTIFFNFPIPPLLSGSNKYTLYALGDGSTSFRYQNTDVYPGGKSDFNAGYDYAFSTYMALQPSFNNLVIDSQVIIGTNGGYFANSTLGVIGSFGQGIHTQSENDEGLEAFSRNANAIYAHTANANAFAIFALGKAGGNQNWQVVSDKRYKKNVATFPNALDTVLNLRGVTFDWKQEEFPDKNFSADKQVGFIAQEVEKVMPAIVGTDKAGYKSVAYGNVVPVLVEAIKAQQKQIQAQQKQMDALKKQIELLQMSARRHKH